MKKGMDNEGRAVYKFSHGVCQGGYLYGHKTKEGFTIEDKEGLKKALSAVAERYGLMDVTIKAYDDVFFIFFMMRPSLAPQKIIDSIQKEIGQISEWPEDYIFNGISDLRKKSIEEELNKLGMKDEQGQ